MRHLRLAILAALTLAGCATTAAKHAIVRGNEVGVTVSNVWGPNAALPLADAHCHQYGKAARLSVSREYSFTYDCVRP